jgi:putative ABC transport system permease protein
MQMTVPAEIIAGLVDRIFRIATLLDAVTLVIGVAALGAIALSLFLAWSLRASEMETAKRLRAGRFVILRLAVAEIALLLTLSAGLAAALVTAVTMNGDKLVAWILAL